LQLVEQPARVGRERACEGRHPNWQVHEPERWAARVDCEQDLLC